MENGYWRSWLRQLGSFLGRDKSLNVALHIEVNHLGVSGMDLDDPGAIRLVVYKTDLVSFARGSWASSGMIEVRDARGVTSEKPRAWLP